MICYKKYLLILTHVQQLGQNKNEVVYYCTYNDLVIATTIINSITVSKREQIGCLTIVSNNISKEQKEKKSFKVLYKGIPSKSTVAIITSVSQQSNKFHKIRLPRDLLEQVFLQGVSNFLLQNIILRCGSRECLAFIAMFKKRHVKNS